MFPVKGRSQTRFAYSTVKFTSQYPITKQWECLYIVALGAKSRGTVPLTAPRFKERTIEGNLQLGPVASCV